MNEEKNTKQKILEESLKLFSEKGYEGVSMREIAAAVGIKGASIYNHFSGKEDIFQGIFEEMTKRYDNMATMLSIPMEETTEAAQRFIGLGEQEMTQLAKALFAFFAQDEFVTRFRRMLIAEQNRSPLAAQTLKSYYFDEPIQYQAGLFEKMQQCGAFAGYEAKTMALHFYSPVYYLLSRYDLEQDYDSCIKELEQHVYWFMNLYSKQI